MSLFKLGLGVQHSECTPTQPKATNFLVSNSRQTQHISHHYHENQGVGFHHHRQDHHGDHHQDHEDDNVNYEESPGGDGTWCARTTRGGCCSSDYLLLHHHHLLNHHYHHHSLLPTLKITFTYHSGWQYWGGEGPGQVCHIALFI